MRLTTFWDWFIVKKWNFWKHCNVYLNVGVFVSFSSWFLIPLLVILKYLSALFDRDYSQFNLDWDKYLFLELTFSRKSFPFLFEMTIYINKHSDIMNNIISNIWGFSTRKRRKKIVGVWGIWSLFHNSVDFCSFKVFQDFVLLNMIQYLWLK